MIEEHEKHTIYITEAFFASSASGAEDDLVDHRLQGRRLYVWIQRELQNIAGVCVRVCVHVCINQTKSKWKWKSKTKLKPTKSYTKIKQNQEKAQIKQQTVGLISNLLLLFN